MTYVMRNLDGEYLAYYNAEAYDGSGLVRWSADYRRALVFDSVAAAMEKYNWQCITRPLRPDGKPNRPLTAFTVTIEPLEGQHA